MDKKLIIRRVLVSAVGSILILFVGMQIMGSLGSRKPPVRQLSVQEQRKPVKVTPVSYQAREIALSGLGKVISASAVDLIAEVQGELTPGAVMLKRGQSFRKGQILFQIQDQEASLGVVAQKSAFQGQLAGLLPDLRQDHPDDFPAWQEYFSEMDVKAALPPLPEVSSEKLKVFLATQSIFNQYYQIRSAEERLKKYVVRAPFSGSFLEVNREVGSVVSPGTQVGRIARSNRLELEVPIRVADLTFVRRGLDVDVFAPEEEARWRGKISRIGAAVDPTTQSVNVYVDFQARGISVYEGQYLRAEMPGRRKLEVMEIPRYAVVNQSQVYVVQDSTLHIKPIRVEKLNKETLYLSGLEAGEYVVVEPLINAYENMPVQVIVSDEPQTL